MRTLPAAIAASSLIAGYATARFSKKRPLGGVVLLAGTGVAAALWAQDTTAARVGTNVGIVLASFGISHPLAKKIGAWPSVITVAAVTAGATYAIARPIEVVPAVE